MHVTQQWGAFLQPLFQWTSSKYYIFWVCVCSLRYLACNAPTPYCHLWSARLYKMFPHYLLNGTTFEKKLTENAMRVSIFCLYKFFVNKSLLIKETNQHWLDVASHLPCLLRSRWPRTFPWTGLSFGFRVVGVNPGFVTRNYIRKKAGVVSSIFFEVQSNVKSLLFLVDTQDSGNKLWCDTSHLQIFC